MVEKQLSVLSCFLWHTLGRDLFCVNKAWTIWLRGMARFREPLSVASGGFAGDAAAAFYEAFFNTRRVQAPAGSQQRDPVNIGGG